ncbi:MAG: transglutaminase-like domain-containing protein [Ignavibacteriales bacterium]|nr:transglutaminase-like domain-containing protein [Ignavibacteriales bacterium]MCF8316186.1 transglutaminase-like domain-containing protein [Ignavibacteriales bacterium]MCF8436688.1 transglutaminase-like domain-containing protein [Ignavibacteriales bacterium]
MKKITMALLFVLILGFIVNAQNKSKIMVLLDEIIDGDRNPKKTATVALEKELLGYGYQLIDENQFAKLNQADLQASKDNPAKAAELGRQLGAEVVISGNAEIASAGEKEIMGVTTILYECTLDAKAVLVQTADIIYSASSSGRRSSQGKLKAMQDASKLAAGKIAAEFNDIFSKIIGQRGSLAGGKLQLRISGADNAQLAELESSLKKLEGFGSLYLRFMDGPGAIFDFEYNGNLEKFREDFPKTGSKFSILGLGGNRIDLKYGLFGAATGEAAISMLESDPLEISGFDFPGIFPANAGYYARNPVGNVTLQNTISEPINNARIRINIPDYMDLPTDVQVREIAPNSENSYPVSLVLDNKKLQANNNEQVTQANVQLSYKLKGKDFSKEFNRPVVIHDRNALSWDDPKAIGAFVTPNDDVVSRVARNFATKADRSVALPNNMLVAVAVWAGLTSLDLRYVQDPRSSAYQSVLDYIQYPAEFLASKTGDCDDSSVLFATLLENVNIPTAFIMTSDHIFVMFDSGVPEKNFEEVNTDKSKIIIKDGRVWVPVETTLLNFSFADAWTAGAAEYHGSSGADPGLNIVTTSEAWSVFTPFSPGITPEINLPQPEALLSKIKSEYNSIINSGGRLSYSSEEEGIRLVKVLLNQQNFSGTFNLLEKMKSEFGDTQPIKLAYANYYFLNNQPNESLKAYSEISAEGEAAAGIDINKGLLYYLEGDTASAVEAFASGIQILGSAEKVAEIIGINLSDLPLTLRGADKSRNKVSNTELKNLMKKAAEGVKSDEIKTASAKPNERKNALAYGGRLSADPTQLKNISGLLYWLVK